MLNFPELTGNGAVMTNVVPAGQRLLLQSLSKLVLTTHVVTLKKMHSFKLLSGNILLDWQHGKNVEDAEISLSGTCHGRSE
jgi:hypothetical protein